MWGKHAPAQIQEVLRQNARHIGDDYRLMRMTVMDYIDIGAQWRADGVRHDKSKKEDIICRWGRLAIRFLGERPAVWVQVNGVMQEVRMGEPLELEAGWRVTIQTGLAHEFWAASDYAIVGEVSTANDDATDNYFANPDVGRFSEIDEDEPPIVKLVSD